MSPSVSDVLDTPHFREGLGGLAAKHELPLATVEDRARRALEAMWTRHDPWASGLWRRFGHLVSKRYALEVDEEGLHQVAELDRRHPLVLLFSHRSYLDTWLLRDAVDRAGLAPIIALAGANLSFWPMGAVIRRTGGLFIRRDAKDDDVYRYALRGYMRYLLETQQNLGWSIEGGRTRTGKLRPPRFGALSYVVDSLRSSTGPEVYIIPVSVVYDQLGEVATLAGEALGGRKRPEDLRWLMEFSATQARVGGTARVDFGEPLPLREHILALEADPKRRPVLVERVALETCHRINRVTPPTASAVVTLALLGAGRALTLEEITATVDPLLEHLLRPPHPPLMGVDPSAAPTEWIHESLEQLLAAGVVERFDGGESAVYYIAPNQHLVAAFYRNTLIHFVVNRAIAELALFLVQEGLGDLKTEIWRQAMRIREVLKFEFFFSRRSVFDAELREEVERIDPEWEGRAQTDAPVTAQRARRWFERSRPHMAHLTLRPFLDAYHLFAHELARSAADAPVDRDELLERCVRTGKQWVLRRKLHSAESVTLELFRNALLLAQHRGLLEEGDPKIASRRYAFEAELRSLVDALVRLEEAELTCS